MSRLIDAGALEKDGWMMHRTVQVDSNTMEYQTKKPTDFSTIESEPCEDAVSRHAVIGVITEYGSGNSIYMSVGELKRRIEALLPTQPKIIRCKDCKHYDSRPCGIVDWYNTADDFCSKAERRTDA